MNPFPLLPRTVPLALLLGGLIAVYFSTWQSLWERWNQSGSEYSHGPLLLGVIVWLLFRERQNLQRAKIKPCYWALLPATLFSLIWSAGFITQVNIVQQLALPCVILFSVTALLGLAIARMIWFPLALIVFALPLWNVLQPALQSIATTACAHIVSWLGVPAHIDGNSITLTSGTFEIAAGCSGLNLFLAASLLGILYAHLNFAARRDQVIVVLLALLVGIVCNWVRIVSIILIAQFSDNIQHPIVQDHDWLGWVWFALLFAVYLFVVNRLPFAGKHGASTLDADQQRADQFTPQLVPVMALLVCMLSVYSAPLLSMHLLNKNGSDTVQIIAPGTMLSYPTQTIVAASAWHPDFHNATSELHLRLAVTPEPIDFHLYFYATQSQGAELVHFDNTITDSQHWHEVRRFDQGDDSSASRWQDVIVQSNSTQQLLLVRYWYAIAGSTTTSSIVAKILQLKGFIGNRTDAALIAVSSGCAIQDCKGAQRLLDQITESAIQQSNTIIYNVLAERSNSK